MAQIAIIVTGQTYQLDVDGTKTAYNEKTLDQFLHTLATEHSPAHYLDIKDNNQYTNTLIITMIIRALRPTQLYLNCKEPPQGHSLPDSTRYICLENAESGQYKYHVERLAMLNCIVYKAENTHPRGNITVNEGCMLQPPPPPADSIFRPIPTKPITTLTLIANRYVFPHCLLYNIIIDANKTHSVGILYNGELEDLDTDNIPVKADKNIRFIAHCFINQNDDIEIAADLYGHPLKIITDPKLAATMFSML